MIRLTILLVCATLAVSALLIWCISRWDTWFGNQEEEPYCNSTMPERIMLTFGDSCEWNRNISWTCGETVSPAFVELTDRETNQTQRINAYGEVFKSRSGKAAYYVARLRNLEDGHSYRYRVCTGDKHSDWYDFCLQPLEEQSFSFIYIGDVQDTLGGITNQILRKTLASNPDINFLICGGDLVEQPTHTYWNEAFQSMDSIRQKIPILTVTGNHDYLKGIIGTLERRFSLTHSYYLDSMEGENQVFTIRYKDAQLFCLDSNREFFYLLTQRQWLEKKLSASQAKWKIVVVHHPLYSIRGTLNNLAQRWMFDDLIREHNVDIVLQGHEHAYARMTNHLDNGIAVPPVYTISHCSPKNYRIEFDELFDRFASGSRYYQKLRTSGDTLFITAVDACTQILHDSLFIVKSQTKTQLTDASWNLPEVIHFTPLRSNKKDAAFAKRIEEYKRRRNTINRKSPRQ